MIKKQHALILALIAILLTSFVFFGKNFLNKKEVINNEINPFVEQTNITSPNSKTIEENDSQTIVTTTQLADGWQKYEFRKAYLNQGTHENPKVQFNNYDLELPKDWTISIYEHPAFDENGKRIQDLGGANLYVSNANGAINISQSFSGSTNCNFSPDSKHDAFDCVLFSEINNENEKYILLTTPGLSENEIPKIFTVCDLNFFWNKTEDQGFCNNLTSIGMITLHNISESQETVDQFIEIMERLKVVKYQPND